MSYAELETLAQKVRGLEEDLQRARRQRRIATGLGLGAAILVWATVAASDPPGPLPCGSGHSSSLYCFVAGAPARAAHVNSNFESVAQGVDAASAAAAAASAAAATKLPMAGGTMTGPITFQGTEVALQGGNGVGNLHIDPESSGSDGQIYLNYFEGNGVTIGNGTGSQGGVIARFNSSTGKATIGGRRVPSEVVRSNCAGNTCSATCPAGTSIKFAFGFHGVTSSNNTADWTCAGGFQWLGTCIAQTSCTVNAGASCSASGIFLDCW